MKYGAKEVGRPEDLAGTDSWIFDLDNTLYPANSDLFSQIDSKMKVFISRAFDLQPVDAVKLQKQYYHEFGTTLRGLMINHDIDPDIFLSYVHDIDHSVLRPDPTLDTTLKNLPGRKYVYTNGSARHAAAVLHQLGITHHFTGIFDIRAGDYIPKPDPGSYTDFITRHSIAPKRAVMFEDSHKNLKPAANLGMITVFVRHANNEPVANEDLSHCHFVTDNLTEWLHSATTYVTRE